MQNANEANRPVAPNSNLQDDQACLCENVSNDQELCMEQSGRLNDSNITECSSTLSSTVSADCSSESEHESMSQSDSVDHETRTKEIEVVTAKTGERKRVRDVKHAMKIQISLKGFPTEVEFPPFAHQQ